MVDAATSLQNILKELVEIRRRFEPEQQTNKALDPFLQRREALKKQTDDSKKGLTSLMQKMLDATMGRGISQNLTATETNRYQNVAKALNKVFKIDGISKSINKLIETTQEAAEQQERKSLFRSLSDKTRTTTQPTPKRDDRPASAAAQMVKLGLLGTALGTLATFLSTKSDLGPLQGSVNMMGKWVTIGGLKSIVGGVKLFVKTVTAPFVALDKLFGSTAIKVEEKVVADMGIKQGEKVGGKFLAKVLPNLMKFGGKGLKALKPIPLIGSLISLYFAHQRFQRGDYMGTLIEVGSGIASLVPGVGTAISIGLDVVNALRDITGKSETKSDNELNWIERFVRDTGNWISDKCYDWPVIGPIIRAFEHYDKNEYLEALTSLSHAVPILTTVLDLVGVSETTTRPGVNVPKFGMLGRLMDWISEESYNWPVIGPLIRSVQHFARGEFVDGLTSLAYAVPFLDAVLDMMNIRETHTRGTPGAKVTPQTLWGMYTWLTSKLYDLPVVGGILKAIDHFAAGEFEKGFDQILPSGMMSMFGKAAPVKPTPNVKLESPTTQAVGTSPAVASSAKTFEQPKQSVTTPPPIELSGLTDLQSVVTQIGEREIELMEEQRKILSDNRTLLQVIAQSIQSMSPTMLGDAGISTNYRDEPSNTRNTYLESINRLATALR